VFLGFVECRLRFEQYDALSCDRSLLTDRSNSFPGLGLDPDLIDIKTQ